MTEQAEDMRRCSCKVGAVATEFDLGDTYERLGPAWTGDDGESVRSLAESFNRQVLRAAFVDAGTLPLDGEVANVYRILTDEGVDEGERTKCRERLRQQGIPIDHVTERFVSHQTLYRHLVNCLDVSYETGEKTAKERVESWRGRLLALQNRTNRVAERAVEQLADSGAVSIGNADVTTEVTVTCEDCGGFYRIEELLDSRTCECASDSATG
ncbi:MAG: hypothetical protein V5A49_03285 [Haloarcula sp.]